MAIYPKEGTLVSDNPYVILTASWVDDAKRAAAADFLAYVRGPDQQAKFQDAGFRSFDGKPGKAIAQANGLLPDQQVRNFPPPAPDVLNAIVGAWAQLRKKANLIFVLDASSSMRLDVDGVPGTSRMKLMKDAVNTSLGLLDNDDQVSVWDFSSELNGEPLPYRVLAPAALWGAPAQGTRRWSAGWSRPGTPLFTRRSARRSSSSVARSTTPSGSTPSSSSPTAPTST